MGIGVLMPLPCSGPQLPDIPAVRCRQDAQKLADCCHFVGIDDEILLHEEQQGRPYYWVVLHADDTPLCACHLEQYANLAESAGDWVGRRADYMALGWYGGDCYLLVIELRDILVNERQGEDKLDQLENSIAQILVHLNEQVTNVAVFNQACDQPERYKVAGIVVAPAGIRGISRSNYTRRIENATYSAIITMMPSNRVRDCRITWSELMLTITVADRSS